MKLKIRHELTIIDLLTLALIVFVVFVPDSVFRIIIGLPFILFFPGYTFLAAFIPRKSRIDGIERILLSFGTSLVFVPLIGLILNFSGLGITVESATFSISAFVFTCTAFAYVRRRRLSETDAYTFEFSLKRPSRGTSVWDKALTLLLASGIIVAAVILINVIVSPKEKFTEFFIKGGNVPQELSAGEPEAVTLSIINHEHETSVYRIEVVMNGNKLSDAGLYTVGDGEKLEVPVTFMPVTAGEDQPLEFFLYLRGKPDTYRTLRIIVDVN